MSFLQETKLIRCQLGTYLLRGLEFMIVSDIIHSFIDRSPADLIFLALIVVLRTAIGFSLEREMEKVRQNH